jgi:porin
MRISPKQLAVGALLAAGLCPRVGLSAQEPPSSTTAAPNRPAGTTAAETPGSTAEAPATDLAHQEELTGDWGGVRARWKEKGVVFESDVTQFYQGVVEGGTDTGSEYNGTAEARFELDLGKLAGWKYWSAEVKGEMRFGGPLLGGTGTISPVNTAVIVPGADGEKATLSSVNLTRLFPIDLEQGKLVALSFGRYNMLDLLDEDFFAGGGTERFWNIAQIGPLTVLRQVPLITNAVNAVYIRGGEPFLAFSLIDPNDHSLETGLDNAFEDGVTFSPGIIFPAKYFGKTAKHSFGGAITTKEYTPFDAIRQIVIPGPPLDPIEPQDGSWSVNYVFRQYIVERGKRDGWGFFSQVAFADQATSPITTFFDAGLGGNGLFEARPHDDFGIAYAYTELSNDFEDNIDLLALGRDPLRAEHQVELFYNLHLFAWPHVTGDLQVIRPTLKSADTAIVPGVNLRVIL